MMMRKGERSLPASKPLTSTKAMKERDQTREDADPKRRKDDRGFKGKNDRDEEMRSGSEEADEGNQVADRFTPREVEDIIQHAREAACAQLRERDGSEVTSSQAWMARIKSSLERLLDLDGPVPLGAVCEAIYDFLVLLQDDLRRPQPSVGNKDVFPLPIPELSDNLTHAHHTLRALMASLNSLYGDWKLSWTGLGCIHWRFLG